MDYLIIIGIILIIVVSIVLIIINSKGKFNLLNIKIKEANNSIELFLQTKKNILGRLIKAIKKDDKYKDEFLNFRESFENIDSNFSLHNLLSKYYMRISKIIFDDDTLTEKSKIVKLLTELKDNEEDLIGSIKFYNDTVVDYNGLLKTFPHSFLSKLFGYEQKEFYTNEKEELFEILK